VGTVFRTGEKHDFERMLTDMVDRAVTSAISACTQVQSEFAKHGAYRSSRLPLSMEQAVISVHETLLKNSMHLVIEFSENSGISVPDLIEISRPKLASFMAQISEHISKSGGGTSPLQYSAQMHERFNQRTENAVKDVELGFIQGRNALVTENSTNQSKALRLLQALYDATRNQAEPAIVHMLKTGLSEPESQAAWRYLKDRELIETFSIPYTARINAAGIDAIEGARRRPDQPSANFPSVSYNIVYNTLHVETMHNSPVQQGGVNSTQTQTITYSPQDLGDLYRLTSELTSHLNELSLDEKQLKKAQAQIATIKAQLSDEPDPIILKQAGRTLRNVIEGAVGSLIATAASQPTIWSWVHEVMLRLFG
jgi:cation transport regulator ChaC